MFHKVAIAAINTHKKSGKIATVTAIQPPGRYGALDIQGDVVKRFKEKPAGDGAWINGGFFVLEPAVFDYLNCDEDSFEDKPLMALAANGQLNAYRHHGFWQAMDTMRDKNQLESMWKQNNPPWKLW